MATASGTIGEEARIRLLLDREVTIPEADEAACRTYFDNNRERFRRAALVEASHILLPAAPDDVGGRRGARRQAETLLAELAGDASAFERLAGLHSACPSAANGGSLGTLAPGQTCDEFDRQVFQLPQGLCFSPLETRYGYHIVRIDRRVEGEPLDYERVRDAIAGYLNERVRRKALSQYLHMLVGEADIDGIDLAGVDSLLMQ
jgi:peptidyl-prolyl cis-trans isomerase C